MLRADKHEFVRDFEEIYKSSSSVIITHYHGLTVSQITALRKSLKAKGVGFRIVKNTLSKIAASRAGFNDIASLLTGPTAVAYSKDPIDAAKVVVEFTKINESLKIVGGLVNNEILDGNAIRQLAKLPSLNELRSKIISVLQAPASGLARVFQAYIDKN